MQLKSSTDAALSGRVKSAAGTIGSILAVTMLTGCPSTPPAVSGKTPSEGAKLRLVCKDETVAKALGNRAQGWAGREGATVETGAGETGDVMIVSAARLGALAEEGRILPIPSELKTPEHPGHWQRIMPNCRDRLAGWGGRAMGVPLAADGEVLVLNTELLNGARPATWDEIADVAMRMKDAGSKAWPARGANEQATLCDFFRVAACYDRPAMGEAEVVKSGGTGATALISFTHVADTGEPRLNTPGFGAAAQWMAKMAPCRAAEEPATALAAGKAAMGVLTLAELARLPKDARGMVLAKFTVAPLPGTRFAFNAKGDRVDFQNRPDGNYIPLFHGGWYGVVSKDCANPAAAFELLADLASPARSLELLSEPSLGFGPFRSEHLQQSRESLWQRYGFDADRQRQLAEALRRNAAESVANPAFILRGPDAEELTRRLADAMTAGRPLETAWPADPAKKPWRRHAAGLP